MSEQDPASDFFDLKMLPSWVKESPNENRYANFAGDDAADTLTRPDRRGGERRQNRSRPPRKESPRRDSRRPGAPPAARLARAPRPPQRPEEQLPPLPKIDIRFLPDPRALENVLAQIKSAHLAYSVFSLARLFLEKPERYDVRLKCESAPLFQMGENGPVASNRQLLEKGAFTHAKENFYRVEVVQSEPIKGNFTSVARDRVSGILLGPTNHHAYQQKLRSLYEQRYSRRMSFVDFQRQIEIVNDQAIVENWKEEARSLTTFTTLEAEPPVTFQNAAEAERHFRQNYLANLLREAGETTVDGVVSRRLPDRALGREIEKAWAQEIRSPSKMMQELIAAFPANGLHLFRHRKAALFVVPVRPRPFSAGSIVSKSVEAILRTLGETPGLNRKQLLEKFTGAEAAQAAPEEVEKKKRALASDLHWLIREGHVIEFNDGTLDLARAKAPAAPKTETLPNEPAAVASAPNEQQPPVVETGESAVAAPTSAEERGDQTAQNPSTPQEAIVAPSVPTR